MMKKRFKGRVLLGGELNAILALPHDDRIRSRRIELYYKNMGEAALVHRNKKGEGIYTSILRRGAGPVFSLA